MLYVVRVMTIADYPAVHRLWLQSEGVGLRETDDSEAAIGRYLLRNPASSFVAEEKNGEIVGAILCGHDGRRGFLYHAAVAAHRRHQGIGKKLVNAALAALREEGINKAALLVFANNQAANAFWQRLGFDAREDVAYRNKIIAVDES